MLSKGYSHTAVSTTFGTWTGNFPSIGHTVFGDLNTFLSVGPFSSKVSTDPPPIVVAAAATVDDDDDDNNCDERLLLLLRLILLDDTEIEVDGIALSRDGAT